MACPMDWTPPGDIPVFNSISHKLKGLQSFLFTIEQIHYTYTHAKTISPSNDLLLVQTTNSFLTVMFLKTRRKASDSKNVYYATHRQSTAVSLAIVLFDYAFKWSFRFFFYCITDLHLYPAETAFVTA